MKMSKKFFPMCAFAAGLLVGVAHVSAQDVWTGNSVATSNWNDPGNWTNTAFGTPQNGDAVTFQGSNRTTNVNDLGISDLDSITFDTSAAAFTLQGQNIGILADGIMNNSTNTQTISFSTANPGNATFTGVEIIENQTWNAAAGNLSITSNVQGNRTNVLGPVALTITGAFDTSISGVVRDDPANATNVLSLVKNGTGSLTLTSANTYTGGTTLNAGTLFADNSSALGTGTLTIAGGTFGSHAFNLVFLNPVSVTGNFSLDPEGGVMSLGGVVDLNGGTRTITNVAGFNVSFSNSITNGTGLILTSSGSASMQFTSAAPNTYSGTTTVEGGLLLILSKTTMASAAIPGDLVLRNFAEVDIQTSEQIANNANVTIHDNGLIRFNSSVTETIGALNGDSAAGEVRFNNLGGDNLDIIGTTDGVYRGTITGNGAVGKYGASTQTFSNANTYTGGTAINGGTLAVGNNNALGSGSVSLNTGILRSAGGPHDIRIGANYFQFGPGTLQLQIGGTNAGVESDLLDITGNAQLGGTLSLRRIRNFNPTKNTRIDIIEDGIGHTGAFSNVVSNFKNADPIVHYDEPFDVYITFQITGFAFPNGLTPNERAVARDLDHVLNDPRANNVVDLLLNDFPPALRRDLDLIAPEELAAIYEIGFSQAVVHNQELMRRMDDIRASVPSIEISAAPAEGPIADKNVVDKNPMPVVTCPEYRWSVYSNGSGDFAHIGDDDFNAHGYDLETGSVMVGADYRLGRHFAIGVDGTYTNSTADLIDNGKIDMDGGSADFYAVAFWKGWFGSHAYIDGAVGGGWNNYDTRRAALLGDTTGHTNGDQLNALVAYGSDWNFGAFSIGTWSSLQYSKIDIDSFTESGSLAPLEFPDQDEDSFRATTGAHASYDFHFGSCGIVRPEVRGAWLHEYNDRAYPIDSRFASGAGDLFRVHGPSIGRDAALIGGGVNVQWNPRISTYVYYDGVLGRANYDSNAVSGGIKVSF